MGIAKWAAIALTILMGLANLGQLAQSSLGLKLLGVVLAAAAFGAAAGLATQKWWGARAVIAVGAVNVAVAVIGALVGADGWPVGLVLSGLVIVLVAVSGPGVRRVAAS